MEHGLFTVDVAARRVRGIVVPWHEASRVSSTKNAPIKFKPGAVRVPRDPSVVTLNRHHDRYDPIGRLDMAEVRENGLYAEYVIADTDEGDAWLAENVDPETGKPRGELVRLSPELRDIIRDGDGYGTATLTGSGVVTEGAFASAGLFAIDDPTTDSPESEEENEPEEPATPKEEPVTEEVATVPGSVPTAAPKKPEPKGLDARGLFALVDKVQSRRASAEERAQVAAALGGGEAGAFALSNITFDDAAGVGAGMVPAQWLGEVLDGTTYQPKYAGLFGQKALTALAMTGWRWVTKPTGGAWAGNKTPIPSSTADIEPVSENATRWAGGHDIAREHRDFGTPGFFEAYASAMRESFARWLDEDVVLTEALAAATDLEADNPAGLTIGAGWSALIDGASQIVAAGLRPTAAVVEQSVWKSMAKVPSSDTLGYLSAALGLADGDLTGFRLVPAPATEIATGHILVVSSAAADVYKLPGSPLRAEALNIANGGIDIGFFGYGGFLVKNAEGIVDVAPYTA